MKQPLATLFLAALALPAAARPRSGIPSTVYDGKASGARFIGLGETGAAVPGGPESPLWNPASLHDLTASLFSADFDVARQSSISKDVLLGQSSLRGRKLTYLGFTAPDAAFFFRPLAGFNERVVTDLLDPANNFVDENLSINQFGFSASNEGEKGSSLGINITYLNAHRGLGIAQTGVPPVVELADGNGFTIDIGLKKKGEYGAVGAAVFNAPGILYWNAYKPDQLPTSVRAGGSFYPIPQFALVADYDKRFYRGGLPQPHNLHLGMELTLFSVVQLRGGAYGEDLNDPDKVTYTSGFSMGSGRGYQADFALRTFRFQDQRVYNYFLSLILPLPGEGIKSSSSSQ